jgi:hypothetical protein
VKGLSSSTSIGLGTKWARQRDPGFARRGSSQADAVRKSVDERRGPHQQSNAGIGRLPYGDEPEPEADTLGRNRAQVCFAVMVSGGNG